MGREQSLPSAPLPDVRQTGKQPQFGGFDVVKPRQYSDVAPCNLDPGMRRDERVEVRQKN